MSINQYSGLGHWCFRVKGNSATQIVLVGACATLAESREELGACQGTIPDGQGVMIACTATQSAGVVYWLGEACTSGFCTAEGSCAVFTTLGFRAAKCGVLYSSQR